MQLKVSKNRIHSGSAEARSYLSVDIDYANHFQTRKDDSSTKGTRTVQKLPLDIQWKLN